MSRFTVALLVGWVSGGGLGGGRPGGQVLWEGAPSTRARKAGVQLENERFDDKKGCPVVNRSGRRDPDRNRLSVDALGNRRWSDPNESREERKHRHLHSCRPRNETCRTSRLWIWFMKWAMFAGFGRHSFDPYLRRMGDRKSVG